MRAERVCGYLAALPDGVSELYVHAATERWQGPEAWPPEYDARGEFEALVDPAALALVKSRGIEAISFAALESQQA